MFRLSRLFRRSTPQPFRNNGRKPLYVEQLEDRCVPSGDPVVYNHSYSVHQGLSGSGDVLDNATGGWGC